MKYFTKTIEQIENDTLTNLPLLVAKFPVNPTTGRTLKEEYKTGLKDRQNHPVFSRGIARKLGALAQSARNALDVVSRDIFGGVRVVFGDPKEVQKILAALDAKYEGIRNEMIAEIPIAQAGVDKFIEQNKERFINPVSETIDEQYVNKRIKTTSFWLNPSVLDQANAEREKVRTQAEMMKAFMEGFDEAKGDLGKVLTSAESQVTKDRNPNKGTIQGIRREHTKAKNLAKHLDEDTFNELAALDVVVDEIEVAKERTDEDKVYGLPLLKEAIAKAKASIEDVDIEIDDEPEVTDTKATTTIEEKPDMLDDGIEVDELDISSETKSAPSMLDDVDAPDIEI